MDNDKSKHMLGTFLVGVAAGWLASLLIPNDARRELRRTAKDKARALKAAFTDPEERERIKEIFTDKTADAREKYLDVKSALIEKFSALRESFGDIDKRKYGQIIRETLDELRREKKLASDQISKLQDYLEHDYQKIRNRFTSSFDDEMMET